MHLLALSFMMFSFTALACPQLKGNYATCRSTTGMLAGSSDMLVTQALQQGVTVYGITYTDDETRLRESFSYRADGRTYTESKVDPESGWVMQSIISSRCAGNTLKIKITDKLNGQIFAESSNDITRQGDRLIQKFKASLMGETLNDEVICQ